jgi:hypothetical protein
VLFLGDSFVAGVVESNEHRIPQQLDRRLPDHPVYNLGVGGYGVDQTLLRFREKHPQFERPIVLFGLLTQDLDRSVLRVRTSAKPYFNLQDGELVLAGVPVPEDAHAWLAQADSGITSYVAANLMRRLRLMQGPTSSEIEYRREEKEEINRAILTAAAADAREAKLDFAFVVFHSEQNLLQEGWRDEFLSEVFAELNVPVFNTRPCLLGAALEMDLPLKDFFNTGDSHPGHIGNRVMADGLAEFLADQFGLPTQSAFPLAESL